MEILNVLYTTLHHIDLPNNQVVVKDPNQNEAAKYVPDLINRIIKDSNIKYFNIKSYTTEVIKTIVDTCASIESQAESAAANQNPRMDEASYKDKFKFIANRLLREQIDAQEKYRQLSEIKKGSLIQSILDIGDSKIYLLALVDHDKFVDEEDLTGRNGLPYSKIALKSALINIDNNFNINSISITDTNRKVSQYWCDGFLEVIETKDDKTNTRNAYICIKQVLTNKLQRKYPTDFLALNNALKIYFTHNDTFSFNECSEFLVSNYSPVDENLNIDDLKESINKLFENMQFDNAFSIDKEDIKKELRAIYDVNKNIQLKVNGPITKLKDTIYSRILEDGDKAIIIKNVDEKIFNLFNFDKE